MALDPSLPVIRTGKRGRPKLAIHPKKLAELLAVQPTDRELAAGLGISMDTLTRRKQELAFVEEIEDLKMRGKLQLRIAQFDTAVGARNPALLIFLGKNWLGQVDRPIDKEDEGQMRERVLKSIFESEELRKNDLGMDPDPQDEV